MSKIVGGEEKDLSAGGTARQLYRLAPVVQLLSLLYMLYRLLPASLCLRVNTSLEAHSKLLVRIELGLEYPVHLILNSSMPNIA